MPTEAIFRRTASRLRPSIIVAARDRAKEDASRREETPSFEEPFIAQMCRFLLKIRSAYPAFTQNKHALIRAAPRVE